MKIMHIIPALCILSGNAIASTKIAEKLVRRGGTKKRFSMKPPTSYKEFVKESNYFIDNSWLIGEVLHRLNTVFLVTAPRKSGKTLNLLMIKEFLEIEVDEMGTKIRREESENFRLFRWADVTYKGHLDKLKSPLLIKLAQFEPKYMGGVPVIFLNFTHNGDVNGLHDVLVSIEEQVRRQYSHHKYLHYVLKRTDMMDRNKSILTSRWEKYSNLQGASEDEPGKAIYFLSVLLYEYFEAEVYILIDDYDSYFNKIFAKGIAPEESRKIIVFFRQFYRRFLTYNPYLRGALVSGVMPLILDDYCLASNNTLVHTIANGTLMEYYGITVQQVRDLLKKFKHKDNAIEQVIDELYGYEFGPAGKFKIINVYAFGNHLTPMTNSTPWFETNDIEWVFDLLHKLDWLHETVVQLVAGNRILVGIDEIHMQANDYCELGNFLNSAKNYEMHSDFARLKLPMLTMKFLLATGYLTQTFEFDDERSVIKIESTFLDETSQGNLTVRIANKEVKQIFRSRLDQLKSDKEHR